MSGARRRPPRALRSIFLRLFPGPRGLDILEDLDREYAARRERRSGAVASGWYVLQLLRPDTWRLARALRRLARGNGTADPGGRGVWPGGLALDLKLAWRMLVKSPALTAVGVLGLAVGIAIGVGSFVALSNFFDPNLPLDEGERIVALSNWDIEASRPARRSIHDFFEWRAEMRSIGPIAAAAVAERALVTGDATPQPVAVAEMSAAGFRVARVPPLLGRVLLPEDEVEGAIPVAVIGHDLWQARFAGDPGVIGRSVLLGAVQHTVVGVMPPGFGLPKNQEVWTALQAKPSQYERGAGPELFVFGRLAPGITRDQAQAELAALGRRAAADFPQTHAHLRPRVLPYTYPLDDMQEHTLWQAAQLQLMVNLLLIAIAVNVAVLVYARTAMRQGEIAMRSALGASRGRIVAQLFVEALALSSLGAGLGLMIAHLVLRHARALLAQMGGIGFWVDYSLQPRSVAYALALAVLSAVIVGVVPALKSTGRALTDDLRRLGSGASLRLGWMWTVLIVAQVGIAVTVLPTALHLGFQEIRFGAVRATFPADAFLAADLGVAIPLRPGMDAEAHRQEASARLALRLPELERRLEADAAVAGVTYEGRLPGRSAVEVEGGPEPGQPGGRAAQPAGVAIDYFDLLGARILAGRDLRASDGGESGGVVVNQAFARRILDGGNPLGRRVRFVSRDAGAVPEEAPAPWLEIVGVVEDLRASLFDRDLAPPFVYYAVRPDDLQSAGLRVRVRAGDAAALEPRLRRITATLDPDLRLESVENLADAGSTRYLALVVTILQFVLGTVLLLSAAGIHALTSLTVTRRRREIGVRTALGARPGRLLAGIFSRVAWQLGLGGLLGSLLGGVLLRGGGLGGRQAAMYLGGVLVLMLATGLLAAMGPARRGLRIQPMEALREE